MKLIADSGSTKTIWYLTNGDSFTTQGLNPLIMDAVAVQTSIERDLLQQLPRHALATLQELHFYGSGCGAYEGQTSMQATLSRLFPKTTIYIYSDMLAAVRATCGQEAGICCILGTGSNSCVFDGRDIADQIPALGYILGDEGAGVALGKRILQAYFYRQLPTHLQQDFEKTYQLTKHDFIHNLYNKPTPNRYLASFAPFVVAHQSSAFVRALVAQVFDEFIQGRVLPYQRTELPVHALGSIATELEQLWQEALIRNGLLVGRILQTPFPSLLHFHQ